MKRWKKVAIWIASIVVVLGVGGLFAANYAVDKVLNSMIGMSVDDLIEEAEPVDTTPSGNSDSDDQNSSQSETGAATQNDDQEQPTTSGNDQESQAEGQNTNSSSESKDDEAASGSGSNSSSGGGSSGYSPSISTDKAKEVEENITVAEKAKVVTTLMGALSASEISTLQKLASGGLSTEEKKEARAIMLEKLTEDQYNELIAIAAKHGLSQGRSYSDVKSE